MTYAEKLKDPRWQKKRLKVLNRDEFTCQCCGDSKSTLHVHHFLYEKNPWDVEDHALITICEKCHQFEHIKNILQVIVDTACVFSANPKKYGESLKILRDYTINFYKK